jgi:hypothetical protein
MTTADTTYGTANMKGKSHTAREDCPWAQVGQASS